MITIIALLEECFVSGELIGFVSEDEEKYFDRITHALQVLTMLKVGIPPEGYIEIKAEDMTNRVCVVKTSIGEITINYKVGLPQGQTPSVLNCNLVSRIKIGQWVLYDSKNPIKHREGFFFGCKDKIDVQQSASKNKYTQMTQQASSPAMIAKISPSKNAETATSVQTLSTPSDANNPPKNSWKLATLWST